MKMLGTFACLTLGVLGVCLTTPSHAVAQSADASLTVVEKAAGWTVLFDGTSTAKLRGFKKSGFPDKGWKVEDGCLKSAKGGGGGDLVSTDEYGDFELVLRFRTTPKANSGIMYRVGETLDTTWQTGPEFQVLDDSGAGEKPGSKHASGALYDMIAPPENKVLKPAGEWNDARIRLKDGVLQHWLNGIKTVECRVDDETWSQMIAGSKFRDYKGFGVLPKGRIALQDHGDEVWYRDIKIRDFSTRLPGEIRLFNGKNIDGWTAFVPDAAKAGVKPESVWSVDDGVLVCKGEPTGYIRTTQDYTNYVLKLEWRFSPVTKKAGNSGVLLRMIGEDKVWPKSVEAQLHSGNAGDFWNIGDFAMKTDPARTNGRNTKKSHMAERPVGEWNEYEIIVDHGTITLKVNGETLNQATDVQEIAGKICLQSEGAEIHFRNIRLAPLP